MGGQEKEACGRCAMSTVVDTATEDGDDARDPFGDARIEVPENQLRRAARPQIWAGEVKRRLDELATRLTYGDRL